MRNFRRQFGKKTAEIAIQLPTLVAVIARLREDGIKIRITDNPDQAYYDAKRKTIYVSRWSPRMWKLMGIAHEYVHACVSPTEWPIPGKTGRQEFIDGALYDELEAIIHEIQIVREMLAAGMHIPEEQLIWYKRYRYGGGRENIRRHLQTTMTCTTGETYPEYYGNWYDEVVPKKKRLP